MLHPDDPVDAEAALLLEGPHRAVQVGVERVGIGAGGLAVRPRTSRWRRISRTAGPWSPSRNSGREARVVADL